MRLNKIPYLSIELLHPMKRLVFLTCSLCFFASTSLYAEYDPQLTKIDSLKAKVSTESDAYELAYLFWEITEYYYAFDFDSSLHYANLYLDSSTESGDSIWIADAYNYIAYIYDQHGDIKLAAEYFQRAMEILSGLDMPYDLAACYNNYGYVVSYSLDQAQGLTYFLKSKQLAESLQDSSLISDACCNVAYFYERLKDFESASEYYQTALDLDVLLGDSVHIAMSYANMANIHLLLGNYKMAEELLTKAKQHLSSYHLPYDSVFLYTTYVDTYLEWSMPDSASKYIALSEEILDKYEFRLVEAYLMRQKGVLCYLQKDYGSCLKFLDKSISIYNKIGSEEALSRIYTKKAEVYAMLNQYEAAYKSRVKANEIYEALGYGNVAGILSKHEQEQLSNIKLQNTRLEFALEKQRIDNENIQYRSNLKFAVITIILLVFLAAIVSYSLFIIRRKNRVLNAKNELISQQKELLETHIEKLKLREEELKELNATKDKFFSIIAHDLKGPLSAIMGVSDLYLKEKECLETEDIYPILESINVTSNFGVSLLENLLEWARSQTGVMKPKPINFCLDSMIDKLNDSFSAMAKDKNIRLEFPRESQPSVYADENMIFSVMRNLIHNAIKYSHTGGCVIISTYEKENSLVTCIEDEGIGISKKDLEKLFAIDSHIRRLGTNKEEGSGLGLILCKEFIEKNQGKIWAEGQENKGCKFSFTIPLSDEGNSSI